MEQTCWTGGRELCAHVALQEGTYREVILENNERGVGKKGSFGGRTLYGRVTVLVCKFARDLAAYRRLNRRLLERENAC